MLVEILGTTDVCSSVYAQLCSGTKRFEAQCCCHQVARTYNIELGFSTFSVT